MVLTEQISKMKSIMGINTINESDLLTEKLMNVEDDVDMIYNIYFKGLLETLLKTRYLRINNIKTINTDTSILKNELCVKAHSLNPCEIIINQFPYGNGVCNYYNTNYHRIGMSFGGSALAYLDSNDGSLDGCLRDIPNSQKEKFLSEFTEYRVKGSIHHELAHWLDDSLNNKHITKTLTKYKNTPVAELGDEFKYIDSHYLEIQAQIHNIKQMYNTHKAEWDELTFEDMLKLSPALTPVFKNFPEHVRIAWLKNIKKRMNREGLLGANMR